MKNKLAENLLRFGIKNLNESEVEKLQRLAEQEPNADSLNLGVKLNALDLQTGVYRLEKELADVNMFMAHTNNTSTGYVDSGTIDSKSRILTGAYARPLYLLKHENISMIFIGRSMIGGPLAQGKEWSVEGGYKIVKPFINENGFVTRNNIQQEVLTINSAKAAYIQIYNFITEGYRNNKEITKLVNLLEAEDIIPSLKDEISEIEYKTFLQHNHDSVMRMIKT